MTDNTPMTKPQNLQLGKNLFYLVAILGIIWLSINHETIFKLFAQPSPIIVSQGADDHSSTAYNYRAEVWAEIRNDGGDGDIIFEATVFQNNDSWKKTASQYYDSRETARMSLMFDEVNMTGEMPQYKIKVYPYGK